MSSSIIFKSKSLLTSSIRHHSSRLSRSCIHKQFNSYANPLYRPDNAVPATSAKGFDGRERSEESRYAREKEVAELKELLAKQNAKIEELEKNVNSKK
ncbi:hypothetical protein MJO28_009224 [Puccinia striiformis f. sp. tritici]|uniref:Uncharacterized protein n=1 Tax=Puccinia striiformis f. sp. tritici TaxID=168172 RepID=A0ACC0E702_9BASI|nr:uncharacterized protein Pst134EA_031758 [Puccinia striiformis f. sp. tritici]KAH9442600.1 hypothetical protein Pst134EA_031758 [Puccinia striiformis f. sp. tritici]KAI7947316.1 hypothetical protein MJO28_009224 [Puccinia striiformis f. sp. tritici]